LPSKNSNKRECRRHRAGKDWEWEEKRDEEEGGEQQVTGI